MGLPFIDDFFGGGGGTQETTSTDVRTQDPQLKDLFAQAQTFAGGGAPDVSAGTGLLGQAAGATADYAAGLPGQIAPAQAASQFALTDAINPSSNPALQEYIRLANEQLTQQYQQQTAPALRNQSVAAGNVGSSRAGIAEGLAKQGLVDAQGRQTAAMSSQGYGQGLQAMMQALGLAPQTAALGSLPGAAYADAARYQTGADTGQYDANARNLGIYKDLISGDFGGTTTGVAPEAPGASPFQNLLGLASAGASIYGAVNPAVPIALNVLGGSK